MPDNNITGFNYPKLVQDARELPPAPEEATGNVTELVPLINGDKLRNPFVKEEVEETKVAPELFYRVFSKVFVIWRPWETCKRCIQELDDENLQLPSNGDYTCPHVNSVEYKDTIDRCLRGEGIISTKEAFNLKNGTRCVHVEWMEADPERAKEIEKMMAEREKNRVYPPDVEGAFAKK